MAETTHISWTDRTWSPWTGCTKISPACDGCYACHLMDTRMGRVEWGEPGAGEGTRDLMSKAYWRKPDAWNRAAAKTGVRPWVFPSLCDPFDLAAEEAWHRAFHQKILDTPNVYWLLLTKRIGNARKIVDRAGGLLWLARNWAIGSTFANQAEWDRDHGKLRDVAQAFEVMSFGSFEPLLSAIDFHGGWLPDWVITGGESDQGSHMARPSHPDWFGSMQGQCASAGVPYHHKQNGEWAVSYDRDRDDPDWRRSPRCDAPNERYLSLAGGHGFHGERVVAIRKVGKKAAGRALDGVIHDARPNIPARALNPLEHEQSK